MEIIIEKILVTQEQMNNLNKWFDTLLNGSLKQGRGSLKNSYENECSYCCLGVACEINTVPNEIIYNSIKTPSKGYGYSFKDLVDNGMDKMVAYPDAIWFEKNYGFRYDKEFHKCLVKTKLSKDDSRITEGEYCS